MTWKKFFDIVLEKCNFHKDESGTARWTCFHDLRFSKEASEKLGANWTVVKHDLENFGGYCDCEVVFNVMDRIPSERRLPRF